MTSDPTKPLPDSAADEPFVLTPNLRIATAPDASSPSIDNIEKPDEQPKDYVNPAEISFEEAWCDLSWDKNDAEAFSNLDIAPLVKLSKEPAPDEPPAGLTELEYDALQEVIRDVLREELGLMLKAALGNAIRSIAQDEAEKCLADVQKKGRIA